jgi:hypothetical protein
MFIHIENHIINITEIRNISNINLGRGKYRITIFLKHAENYEHINLKDTSKEEAEATMEQLAKSCLEFGAKK